jgi:putative tryptophan/tyrosine transport system substrate-binding protein
MLEDTAMPHRTIGLLATLALGLLLAPLTSDAQVRAKIPRLGFLGDTPGPYAESFHQGLRELGYVDGQNITVESRWAEGQDDRLRAFAAELVQLPVDIIVTPGGKQAVRPSM